MSLAPKPRGLVRRSGRLALQDATRGSFVSQNSARVVNIYCIVSNTPQYTRDHFGTSSARFRFCINTRFKQSAAEQIMYSGPQKWWPLLLLKIHGSRGHDFCGPLYELPRGRITTEPHFTHPRLKLQWNPVKIRIKVLKHPRSFSEVVSHSGFVKYQLGPRE